MRPIETRYEARTPTSGRVTLELPRPMTEAGAIMWEGVLGLAFDYCGASGEVLGAEREAGGRVVTFEVRWR